MRLPKTALSLPSRRVYIYIYMCTGEKKQPKTDADDKNADGVQH